MKPALFTIHMSTTGANKWHRPHIEAITICEYMVMANNCDIHFDADNNGYITIRIPMQYVTFLDTKEETDNAN